MDERTCSIDGCERKHGARGMCYSHYGTWHRRTHGRKSNQDSFVITCVGCGEQATSSRPEGKYCSELCYHFTAWGPRFSAWPKSRPKVREPKPKPAPFAEQRECVWCGAEFVARIRSQVFCSTEHKVKAKRSRRRGRAHGSTSHYTWSEVMRLFIRFDRCCAYCEQPIPGQPEPDHVVPLSRGGSNSITNILPSCHGCNADKRDLFLHEWAADRAARGKPTRITAWATGDPRIAHLTDALLTSPAA